MKADAEHDSSQRTPTLQIALSIAALLLGAGFFAVLTGKLDVGLDVGRADQVFADALRAHVQPAALSVFALLTHLADAAMLTGLCIGVAMELLAYGMLAYLALRLLPTKWHLPALLTAVAIAFSVGASRLFLRVHFASDVLAGFMSGAAWLAVCIMGMELLRRAARGWRQTWTTIGKCARRPLTPSMKGTVRAARSCSFRRCQRKSRSLPGSPVT